MRKNLKPMSIESMNNNKSLEKPSITKCNNNILISIPMKLKHNCGRKEVIIPEKINNNVPIKSPVQKQLTLAISKAFAWRNAIETGYYESIHDIADKLGVTSKYITREIKLTYLAPDIIEMIFNGCEPDGLSHTKLLKSLPLLWEEQKKKLKIV